MVKALPVSDACDVAVIGGGPAGLRAAEVAAGMGAKVRVYEAMPSVGRKFLVAGKGGLNLTHSEARESFARRYTGPGQPAGMWPGLLAEFDSAAVREWVESFGLETMVASSGRVYPAGMKAAPLLRRWVARLRDLGVAMEMRHRLVALSPANRWELAFANGRNASANAVVLALGGGSWPQTGSDGAWLGWLRAMGVECRDLQAANCGWEVAWSAELLAAAEGLPLKNLRVSAGEQVVEGELLITRYGLEGGAIYQLGAALRQMESPLITLDMKPTFSTDQLIAKLAGTRGNLHAAAVRRWKLSAAAAAVLAWKMADCEVSAQQLAQCTKACEVQLTGPRPIKEAISSAGGVAWSGLDEQLMLRRFPGVFVAGEMVDWEAPTGGFLLQGCLATGTRAGRSAVVYAGGQNVP